MPPKPQKPTKQLKKPAPRSCGDIRYRVIRPKDAPREDGRWYWRAEKYQDGGSETVWAGWATMGEADHVVASLASGQITGGGQAGTVRELLQYWLGAQEERPDLAKNTVRIRTYQCRALIEGLSGVLTSRLDGPTLESYRDQGLRAGKAASSISGEIVALRAAWDWGKSRGLCPERTLPKIKVRGGVKRDTPAPERENLVAAMKHLKGWPRLAILLFEGTGCRLSEITTLTWDRVDLKKGEIQVTGKTGTRTIPLSGPLLAELIRQYEQRRLGRTEVLGVVRLSAQNRLYQKLAEACEKAGVPRFSPQGLRRAAVDALYEPGGNIGAAAKMMGHSPTTALRNYRRASAKDTRSAIQIAGLGRLAVEEQLEERKVVNLDDHR